MSHLFNPKCSTVLSVLIGFGLCVIFFVVVGCLMVLVDVEVDMGSLIFHLPLPVV